PANSTVPSPDRRTFEARFDIIVPHSNLLFAANEPLKADIPYQFQTGQDKSYSTSLHALNRTQASGIYTVTSLISIADKQSLRKAPTAYPDYIKQKYLQLPSTLPVRVKNLAHQLLDNIPSPYDKAETLETFLRSPPFSYSPQVKSTPPGRDPVDYFLFDLRADFCEYFASAMVVMLREVGGDRTSSGDNAANPDAADRVNRGEQDLDTPDSGGEIGAVAIVRQIDPRPLLVLLAALLALLAVFVARFNWRFRKYGPIDSAWAKTRLLASYVGYPPHPSETPYEYATTLGDAIPE